MPSGDIFRLENGATFTESPVVEALKAENARLRAELREAHESERRLWRAFAMAKGAAEKAATALSMAYMAGTFPVDMNDPIESHRDESVDAVRLAEKIAGCAVEE